MGRSKGSSDKSNLTFLSYNLYCLPWLATLFAPSTCPLPQERSTHFLQYLDQFDVLALQEVWDPRYRKIEKHAKRIGMHVVGSSAPSLWSYLKLKFFGGGLMIVSKYPIVDRQETFYGGGTHADGYVTKGVLYAKIQVGSSFIHVFNTHLQASYGHEFNHDQNKWAPIRKAQLERLYSFIEEITSEDNYPIVLLGDFNVNARNSPTDGSDSKEYVDMMEMLKSEYYEVVDVLKEFNNGEHPVTYGGQGVKENHKSVGGQRLDFVFELRKEDVRHKFTKAHVVHFDVKEEVFTHVSDHFGAVASMELRHYSDSQEDGANSLAGASISLRSA